MQNVLLVEIKKKVHLSGGGKKKFKSVVKK